MIQLVGKAITSPTAWWPGLEWALFTCEIFMATFWSGTSHLPTLSWTQMVTWTNVALRRKQHGALYRHFAEVMSLRAGHTPTLSSSSSTTWALNPTRNPLNIKGDKQLGSLGLRASVLCSDGGTRLAHYRAFHTPLCSAHSHHCCWKSQVS